MVPPFEEPLKVDHHDQQCTKTGLQQSTRQTVFDSDTSVWATLRHGRMLMPLVPNVYPCLVQILMSPSTALTASTYFGPEHSARHLSNDVAAPTHQYGTWYVFKVQYTCVKGRSTLHAMIERVAEKQRSFPYFAVTIPSHPY